MTTHRVPAVSVVITTYNQSRYIGEAIGSALAQTFGDREIVVVDDGSTDDTPAVIASFGDRVRSVWQRNQGVAGARNTGILAARGRLIAFLDGDDLWEPRTLAVQVDVARRYPEAALIAVDGVQFGAGGILADSLLGASVKSRLDGEASSICVPCYRDLLETTVIYTTSQIMTRREVLDEVGLSDPTFALGSDYDLYLRIAARRPFAFSGEKLTRWRYHEASASGALDLRRLRCAEDELAVLARELRRAPAHEAPAIRRALDAKVSRAAANAYHYGRRSSGAVAVRHLWRMSRAHEAYRGRILLHALALALPEPVARELWRSGRLVARSALRVVGRHGRVPAEGS